MTLAEVTCKETTAKSAQGHVRKQHCLSQKWLRKIFCSANILVSDSYYFGRRQDLRTATCEAWLIHPFIFDHEQILNAFCFQWWRSELLFVDEAIQPEARDKGGMPSHNGTLAPVRNNDELDQTKDHMRTTGGRPEGKDQEPAKVQTRPQSHTISAC